MRRILSIATLLVFIGATGSGAAVLDEVRSDFEPLSGYVIMPVDGEFLIDKDSSSGVTEGDLFAVIEPGEKIVHPVTKEVLGTLDKVKTYLRVTRTKSGYSYARPLAGKAGVGKGDVIRRYENIPAIYWDYTGKGEGFFEELKNALPHLEWQRYDVSQAERPNAPQAAGADGASLLFVLTAESFEVRDGEFRLIHAYAPPKGPDAPASRKTPEARMPVPSPEPSPVLSREEPAEEPAQGLRFQDTFPGYENLGNLPTVTRVTDFLEDGERLLMAATDGKEIQVFTVGQKLSLMATGDSGFPAQILGLHWWRPDAGGEPMLAATAWSDQRLSSLLFALRGNGLVRIAEHLPYIFGAFDRDGDSRPELLLAQSLDRETFFGHRYYRMDLRDGELQASSPGFDLPRDFTVQGSAFVDITGNGRPETILVRHGFLHVYQGEKEIYRSPKEMGGSISVLSYLVDPDARDSRMGVAVFEVTPEVADLDGDGGLELIVPAADRSILRAPGLTAGLNETWLAVVKYREGMFVKGRIGDELDTPLPGIHIAQDRILFVATEPPSFLGKGGASHLLAYPLPR